MKSQSQSQLSSLAFLNFSRIQVDSPFVVRLMATYNGKEHVFFLLEALGNPASDELGEVSVFFLRGDSIVFQSKNESTNKPRNILSRSLSA